MNSGLKLSESVTVGIGLLLYTAQEENVEKSAVNSAIQSLISKGGLIYPFPH